ncbi:pentapeptide repeat-containing protein [Fibrella sp. HMF5335]|uniref:Pentapeptide repeat-containing protein n=1 Tax=Fibrella rubiginis TaxID=2817060 RepID=A0A939K495_9BACT|nr:pentapeptide repeat-containing protein [Fibrella rubiginis]MBO0935936.1 pentapeptide repeat-containing protein [Fibrella rubiginis]
MDYYNQTFDQNSELPDSWNGQDFEKCTFRKLDLAGALLTKSNFINCQFEECNLSKVTVGNTKFDEVHFIKCRLTQVDFGHCNPFGFSVGFQGCNLDFSVFLNRNMKKTRFDTCSMKEAHFLKCDLAGATFLDCDLELAKFGENNLTQADFTSSYNIRLNPDDNKLKRAKFSLRHLPGLLSKYELDITN